MRNAINALWNYFKDMNSERGGGVSIKRNMTWGMATLLVFVEIFTLIVIPHTLQPEIVEYILLCKFYAALNAVIILLMSGVTTLEKLVSAAQKLKNSVLGGGQSAPEAQKEDLPKQEI